MASACVRRSWAAPSRRGSRKVGAWFADMLLTTWQACVSDRISSSGPAQRGCIPRSLHQHEAVLGRAPWRAGRQSQRHGPVCQAHWRGHRRVPRPPAAQLRRPCVLPPSRSDCMHYLPLRIHCDDVLDVLKLMRRQILRRRLRRRCAPWRRLWAAAKLATGARLSGVLLRSAR